MTSRPQPARRTVFGHDPRALAAVFLGGAAGTVLRALLAAAIPRGRDQWPWATFTANVVGVAVLALVLVLVHERLPYRRLLLGTGLCGGLTTFSTFQVEVVEMLRDREFGLAATYLVVSLIVGLAVAHVVSRATVRLRDGRE